MCFYYESQVNIKPNVFYNCETSTEVLQIYTAAEAIRNIRPEEYSQSYFDDGIACTEKLGVFGNRKTGTSSMLILHGCPLYFYSYPVSSYYSVTQIRTRLAKSSSI